MRNSKGWVVYAADTLVIGCLKYIVNIKSAGLGEFTIRSLREAVLRNSSSAANSDMTPDETSTPSRASEWSSC